MKFIRSTGLLFVIVMSALCVWPFSRVHAQRYTFQNLNIDEGLIQSQALCLTQDKIGNLWVGTMGGLSRYDGRTFTNYTVRNGLLMNMVSAVVPDARGNIWIGTQKGLTKFNGATFTNYVLDNSIPRLINFQQDIHVVNDTIWWRVSGNVYYLSGEKLHPFTTPVLTGKTTALLAERDGIWVAQGDTLFHSSNGKWETLTFAMSGDQRAPAIINIFRDGTGGIWLGTTAGLYYLAGKQIKVFELNGQPLNYITVSSLSQDRSGALWLATKSGVMKISGNMLQIYNKKNGLCDNMFYDVMTDHEGNVWMSSDGQGIYRFSGTLFTVLDESMGLPSAQIMAISSNKRDSLFLGTYESGLFVFNNGKITPRNIPSKNVPAITSLCYTHDQRLWVATRENGLYEYDHETFRQYTTPQHGFPSNFITQLYEDREHRLWIAFGLGVLVREQDTFRTIPVRSSAHVVSFLSIGMDSVLMTTEKDGLFLYNAGNVAPFVTRTIADSSQVNCFIRRGADIWLGSSDNGVIWFDMATGQAQVINKANGLRSDFIYNIIDDSAGNIWVGTGFGIHKISFSKSNNPQVTFYGKAQGVAGMESNINAVLKLGDGSIWFGTTNGAVHYQPHSSVVSAAPASIVMQSVKLVGESSIDRSYYTTLDPWYGVPQGLQLPFKKNIITFTFQAITMSGAEQVLYRYRMEGIDAPWSEWSTTNSVTYSALPPGKYTFHVECLGSGGAEHPELVYAFEIITPFHKTWWFRTGILVICMLIGIALQSVYNKRKQRKQKLMARLRAEEQAKIRMRTAEDFHDEIGNKLTRINVLTSVLKNKVVPDPEVLRLLNQIEENTTLLYGGTRDILWSLKPSNDNLYEILVRIQDFGNELFEDTDIKFSVSGIEEKWRTYKLPMDMSRNLIMIFKEALNNALKYAKANNVTLDVSMKRKDVLQLTLRDDGLGFDLKGVKRGNGVNNMHIRAGRLNGKIYIDSFFGKGTIISLTFRLPRNK